MTLCEQNLNPTPQQRITLKELRNRPRVAEWLSKVSRRGTGSEHTQHQYAKELRKFIEWAHSQGIITKDVEGREEEALLSIGDRKLPEDPKKSVAEKIAEQYFDYLEKDRKKARSGCLRAYAVVRSFFRSFGISFIEKCPRTWFSNIQRPPLKEELHRIWEAASLDEKLMIGMARDLGWRREDIVTLTYSDIKQDYEAGQEYLFIQKTTKKEKVIASNFIGKEVTALLREKLEQRRREGEKFADATPLLREDRKSKPVIADEFRRKVKRAGAKIGVLLTPKLLRKWFRTQATNAGLPRDRVCQMGGWAIPGVGMHYDLPTREEALESFKHIEPFLMFTKASAVTTEDVDLRVLKGVAKALMPEDRYKKFESELEKLHFSTVDKVKWANETIAMWKQRAKASGGLAIANIVGSRNDLKTVAKFLRNIMLFAEESQENE